MLDDLSDSNITDFMAGERIRGALRKGATLVIVGETRVLQLEVDAAGHIRRVNGSITSGYISDAQLTRVLRGRVFKDADRQGPTVILCMSGGIEVTLQSTPERRVQVTGARMAHYVKGQDVTLQSGM